MALTSNSSKKVYLPATEYLKRADLRLVADLVSDSGYRTGGSSPSADALKTNANLAAALLDASGDVEAACLRGERYGPDDLLNLVYMPDRITVAAATAAQGRLFRLMTRLTTCYLWERRPDKGPIPETYKAAWDHLDALAEGQQIFGFIETEEAGLLQSEVETPEVVETRNLTTVQARGYYGRRGNQIPSAT